MTESDQVRTVPVSGGDLAYEVRQSDSAPVLVVHGLSSQRRLWDWLRADSPGLSLIAPDLRGRGDSIAVTGPSSVAQHVADLVAVLDAEGIDQLTVCGMSMGAFIAVELAVSHPDRVRELVLIDGGFPMPPPPGLTRELIPTVFADRLARLDREWSGVEEYRDFFVANTAPMLDPADPLLLGYLAHDLAHDLSGGRVRLAGSAVVSDATDIFFGPSRWDELAVATWLSYAEFSVGAGSEPAYQANNLQRFQAKLRSATLVPGVDHAGSIMTTAGAHIAGRLIREAQAD